MQKVTILKRSDGKAEASKAPEQKTLLRRPPGGLGGGPVAPDTEASSVEATIPELPPVEEESNQDDVQEYKQLLDIVEAMTSESAAENERLLVKIIEAERARIDEVFRTRQEALLRLISNYVNEHLPEVIMSSVSNEISRIADEISCLAVDTTNKSLQESLNGALSSALGDAIVGSRDELAAAAVEIVRTGLAAEEVRRHFAAAFKSTLLPAFEESTRSFLLSFSSSIGTEVKQNLVPALNAEATRLKTDLSQLEDTSRSMLKGMSEASATVGAPPQTSGAGPTQTTPTTTEEVVTLLRQGDYAAALSLATDSGDLEAVDVATSGIVEEADEPDRASNGLSVKQMLLVLHSLSASTSNISGRLRWLSDLSVTFADAYEEDVAEERIAMQGSGKVLDETVSNTSKFPVDPQKKADLKYKKLTVHLLNSLERVP